MAYLFIKQVLSNQVSQQVSGKEIRRHLTSSFISTGKEHEGIDIFAKKGTAVVAVCDGIIVSSGNTPRGGKVLWLQSFRHRWKAYYAHLDQKKVKPGQFVKKGQVLGTVGNTGNAKYTPSHLHFGIYKSFGGAMNPLPYVKNSPRITVAANKTAKS